MTRVRPGTYWIATLAVLVALAAATPAHADNVGSPGDSWNLPVFAVLLALTVAVIIALVFFPEVIFPFLAGAAEEAGASAGGGLLSTIAETAAGEAEADAAWASAIAEDLGGSEAGTLAAEAAGSADDAAVAAEAAQAADEAGLEGRAAGWAADAAEAAQRTTTALEELQGVQAEQAAAEAEAQAQAEAAVEGTIQALQTQLQAADEAAAEEIAQGMAQNEGGRAILQATREAVAEQLDQGAGGTNLMRIMRILNRILGP